MDAVLVELPIMRWVEESETIMQLHKLLAERNLENAERLLMFYLKMELKFGEEYKEILEGNEMRMVSDPSRNRTLRLVNQELGRIENYMKGE